MVAMAAQHRSETLDELGRAAGNLKVPVEVLQAVVVDKEQCVPVERVAEYVTTNRQDQLRTRSMRVF